MGEFKPRKLVHNTIYVLLPLSLSLSLLTLSYSKIHTNSPLSNPKIEQ
jgi:hypothetical protein